MMTRHEFDQMIRRLSVLDPGDQQYHCRVEICVTTPGAPGAGDWRVLTDTCTLECNIPLVLEALATMLWIYVIEHHPDARAEDCRKLGKPSHEGLDKGCRVWPAPDSPGAFLAEMEAEYNQKTNRLIERHSQQVEQLRSEIKRLGGLGGTAD